MTSYKRTAKIKVLDEVNCAIIGLRQDHIDWFYEHFARRPPNYYFNPKFKLGAWDGKIRYFHQTGKTYVYLLPEILPKLESLGYDLDFIDQRKFPSVPEIPHVNPDRFAHIKNPNTGEPFKLRYYQVEAVNTAIDNAGGVVIAGTGAGKAQPLTSKVLTPTGWKLMGDIQVGDIVTNPIGGEAKVIGIFPQGEKPIYEITFHDGSKTRTCKEHLWEARVPKQLHKAHTETKIISTNDIIAFLERKRSNVHTPGNISIPLCAPTEIPERKLPIDPYVLGLLIGDGCLKRTPLFSTKDPELLESLEAAISDLDLKVVRIQNSNCDYRISKLTNPKNRHVKNALVGKLETLELYGKNSYNKFIPSLYKQSSKEQRLALLQGLMDTDGIADQRGNASYSTSSEQLARDVQELCWSLGMICTITNKTTNYNTISYTLFIRCREPHTLFRLPRKKSRCRQQHADGRIELTRRIVDVRLIGVEEAKCIMLDSENHLYITDDYIVTHNTIMCAALADAYYQAAGLKTIVVVPNGDLVEQTRIAFEGWELDTGEYSGTRKDINHASVISTWQALQHNPKIIQNFDVVIVDECHGLKGQVLTNLLNDYGKHIPYRFGFTGTLPKAETDAMSVRIAVGDVIYEITAKRLMDEGYLATLFVDIFQLEENFREQYEEHNKHNPLEKPLTYTQFKDQYFSEWPQEISYLRRYQPRIEWIRDFIEIKRDEKKGNVFVLVDSVQFGKKLEEAIPNSHFLHGKDHKKVRKAVYDLFANNDDMVVIATAQIAQQGLDIARIFHLVMIDLGKSFVRVIQSLGRGLRKASDKHHLSATDICSDLKYSKRHLAERIKYYREAEYPYKKHVVKYDEML